MSSKLRIRFLVFTWAVLSLTGCTGCSEKEKQEKEAAIAYCKKNPIDCQIRAQRYLKENPEAAAAYEAYKKNPAAYESGQKQLPGGYPAPVAKQDADMQVKEQAQKVQAGLDKTVTDPDSPFYEPPAVSRDPASATPASVNADSSPAIHPAASSGGGAGTGEATR